MKFFKLINEFIDAVRWSKKIHEKNIPYVTIGRYAVDDKIFKKDGFYTIVLKKRGENVMSLQVYDSKLPKGDIQKIADLKY